MTATLSRPHTADALIPPELFDRVVARIVHDHDQTPDRAARIMEQALAFLAACAANPGAGLAPSEQVDIGWHMFILYTHEYAEFCERTAGRFIHHVPEDDTTQGLGVRRRLARTVEAIRNAGYWVDEEFWFASTKCGNCHEDGNCTASGSDGNDPGVRA